MKRYETIFSVGPEPYKTARKRKKLIEIANTLLVAFMWPFAKIATINKGFSKLIYTAQAETFSAQNKDAYFRYELLWKQKCDHTFRNENYRDYAIVMQGQIIKDDEFTWNTLMYYRHIYPDATIVLSTWEDEPKEIIEDLERNGILCVVNRLPDKSEFGRGNLNLQLINSLSGIRKVQEKGGVKYVLKTRADQRIYMRNFLGYFSDLLVAYPCRGDKLTNRLVFMNCEGASTIYYPFKMSDMLVFGSTEDVVRLYDIPQTPIKKEDDLEQFERKYNCYIEKLYALDFDGEYTSEQIESLIPDYKGFVRYKMKATAELYILSHFISNVIQSLEDENVDYLDVYLSFLRDYAVVVDKTAIELYWKKYHHQYCKIQNYQMEGQLDHAAWLDIYLHYRGKKE